MLVSNQTETFFLSNSPTDVVKRLIMPISGTGRNVTMDNWFTSVPLAKSLLEDNNLTMIGTLRKNKKEIPKDFLPSKSREVLSSTFGFYEDITLVSYVPKKNASVLLISTMHHDTATDDSEQMKPEIIKQYNVTKGGVDVVDEMKGSYSVARKSNRWPLTLFFSLMNIAGINSQIIFQKNTGKKVVRRYFLKELAFDLIREHINERKQTTSLPNPLKRKIREFCGEPENKVVRSPKIERCSFCTTKQNRKTKQFCQNCSLYICKEHAYQLCVACAKQYEFSNVD